MSDASQGPGWWQAADGKWYPPPPTWPPTPVMRQNWEIKQDQLRWKQEHRKGLRHRWDDLSPKGKFVAVLAVAAVLILAGVAVVLAPDRESSSYSAADKDGCSTAAAVQMSNNNIDLSPKNTASVEIFSAYLNRCLAHRSGISEVCGWALRAASGDKPVAGCGRYSWLPLVGFRSLEEA